MSSGHKGRSLSRNVSSYLYYMIYYLGKFWENEDMEQTVNFGRLDPFCIHLFISGFLNIEKKSVNKTFKEKKMKALR